LFLKLAHHNTYKHQKSKDSSEAVDALNIVSTINANNTSNYEKSDCKFPNLNKACKMFRFEANMFFKRFISDNNYNNFIVAELLFNETGQAKVSKVS